MKPGARIAAVIELYDGWTQTRDDADRVISGYFGNRRYIGGGDRREISERFYNLIRHQARLGWWLAECGYEFQDGRARMIAELVLQDNRSADDISDMFSGEQFCPNPLHPAEKHLINKLTGKTLDHDGQPGAVKTELPKWLYAELLKLHHENLPAEMAAYNQPAKLDLRVNRLRGTVEDAIKSLQADGIHNIEKLPYAPNGLRLPLGVNMLVTAAYKDGLIEIQDEASQICVRLVDAKPGMHILDMCAGGGGKTLGMASDMRGKGRILACDTHGGRLDNSRKRAKRAGAGDCIQQRIISDERDSWLRNKSGFFDRVLLDVPCSGLGTLRRNPALRWRIGQRDIRTLMANQSKILKAGAAKVTKGGRLIYATCSIMPEENERLIETFMRDRKDFRPVPISEIWPDAPKSVPVPGGKDKPWLRLSPNEHGTDGFFVAVFERTAKGKVK
ncbi:rRNA cytosine-C5-methyltransferase [Thalassospira lucentensis]|uniref:rRNA cytosine-C5-methyltransferase n=1 Tax=Thalassospira lucentensis TaxID=168935 RepID=A0A154L3L6_9PROT|nr:MULTISPECIES: RsmB/NOP family class I SAM-dependent RNA methyltransferase [Thalassospira]KZB62023.1 rRNA cytosine-C5-methyltransferase [Thalassospira lucentensis]MCH2276303.1 RsmB/NOP family class I SAM-dependent RNA methyltransferase [Thalassospira sp.]